MKHSISEILFDEERIHKRISELAEQISADYKDKSIQVICILKGSFVFLADLIRYLTIPVEIDFMAVSSYGAAASSSGKINIKKDIDVKIEGKDVLIIEDIVDTGITLENIMRQLSGYQPKSIKIATLLYKPDSYQKDINVDYIGFSIPNEFIVGYGLDYNGFGRNYEDIYTLIK